MSGFQIPGLGQAKPNESLPPLPADVLAAAAAVADDKTPPTEAAEAVDAAGASSTQDNHQSIDAMNVDGPESPPSLTGALEAAIGGLATAAAATTTTTTTTTSNAPEHAQAQAPPPQGDVQAQQVELQNDQGEHPEWEVDSSPYESSSDPSSSSSSSSSDDDDDDDSSSDDRDSDNEAYQPLGVEEMARLLMEAEGGGSDDEGGDPGRATGSSAPAAAARLRTKNELAEHVPPRPDVTITPDMQMEELGSVENIVDTILLVRAVTPGEYQVLDTGSVLCTADRRVVGAVAETMGKVLQPMYTVHFASADEITQLGLEVGTRLFYPVDHARYVFTEPLKNIRGSDASNIHDEEVGDDEMEFSDDEKEAEHKRARKQQHKRKDKDRARGSRNDAGSSTGATTARKSGADRPPHPLSQEMTLTDGLNYDDDDGPYKPLARPPGFGSGP
ncbi:hypothetical protein E4U41_003149, partial [Claviceps citrina]